MSHRSLIQLGLAALGLAIVGFAALRPRDNPERAKRALEGLPPPEHLSETMLPADSALPVRAEVTLPPDAEASDGLEAERRSELAYLEDVPRDPIGQARWMEANRQLYLDADREMLPKKLEEFRAALATGDSEQSNEKAQSLLRTSIAVLLAIQGREQLMLGGDAGSMKATSADHHKFWRNGYVYEFHRSEFPEYFDLMDMAPWSPNNSDGGWGGISSTVIIGVEAHAQRAMSSLSSSGK
jgi:hypothetical protein